MTDKQKAAWDAMVEALEYAVDCGDCDSCRLRIKKALALARGAGKEEKQ